jgi:hypothetical protein
MVGKVAPLETMPAPVISGVTLTSMPGDFAALTLADASGAAVWARLVLDKVSKAARERHKGEIFGQNGNGIMGPVVATD